MLCLWSLSVVCYSQSNITVQTPSDNASVWCSIDREMFWLYNSPYEQINTAVETREIAPSKKKVNKLFQLFSKRADWLRAGRSGDRIPVGARFSVSVQTDPGAHPASYTMGSGSFPGVESCRGVTLTTHPLLVPRSKNRVKLYFYSPSGPSWPVIGWHLFSKRVIK
jgi:hypothetical protein